VRFAREGDGVEAEAAEGENGRIPVSSIAEQVDKRWCEREVETTERSAPDHVLSEGSRRRF
jgi:hypothetical protein